MSVTTRKHAYRDPATHKFAKRPDAANTLRTSEASARYQASRDHDAETRATTVRWDFSQHPTEMPQPPAAWQETAWRDGFEPVEREGWIDWRGLAIGIVAGLCGGVLVAGVALVVTGTVFGFDPVEVLSGLREVLR